MARLNEPPITTDPSTIEALKRKFMRQNRDIARSNSNQSLKIRMLETECSALLSENLTLRGRVIELEKLAADGTAQRVADHALAIKARMEAQLAEWGAMLAGLGHEPPSKRHCSPNSRNAADRLVASINTTPLAPHRRIRDPSREQEIQEGRLPTISENKPYQRQTLNRDEILALCSHVEELGMSPELGPPPKSRYVDEDAIKLPSPTKITISRASSPEAITPVSSPSKLAILPKLNVKEDPMPDPTKPLREVAVEPVTAQVKSLETRQLVANSSSGAKRKYGDDAVANKPTAPPLQKAGTDKAQQDRPPLVTREIGGRKILKDLSTRRRERKEESAPVVISKPVRSVLAAKSTNESPRKPASQVAMDYGKPVKPEMIKPSASLPEAPRRVVQINKAKPRQAAPDLVVEQVAPIEILRDIAEDVPGTPAPAMTPPLAHDTPPPAEISALGEVARPSRRVRAAVSYAEPNLRDKMRRPTKELFDAVAGEGKYVHRPASSLSTSATVPNLKTEATAESAEWRQLPESTSASSVSSATTITLLPERRKASASTSPPFEAVDQVKTNASAREALSRQLDALKSSLGVTHDDRAAGNGVSHKQNDPYEFDSNSNTSKSNDPAFDESVKTSTSRAARMARKSSASVVSVATAEGGSTSTRNVAPSRKRASMQPQPSVLEDSLDSSGDFDATAAGEGAAVTNRLSRRRSMML